MSLMSSSAHIYQITVGYNLFSQVSNNFFIEKYKRIIL